MVLVILEDDWPTKEFELKQKLRKEVKENRRLRMKIVKLQLDLAYYKAKSSCFKGLVKVVGRA